MRRETAMTPSNYHNQETVGQAAVRHLLGEEAALLLALENGRSVEHGQFTSGEAVNYLDVPYAEKDQAKAWGACWDPQARRWYVPWGIPVEDFSRWLPRPDLPELLPGEDRTYGSGIYVDLIPSTSWFSNVRSCVAPSEWDRVRRMVYGRANYTCEACGAVPKRVQGDYLEAHERWSYDETTHVQRLVRLIALCTACHAATHFGLSQMRGHGEEATQHLMRVAGATRAETLAHIEEAFAVWRRLSEVPEWTLDLSILTDAGVELASP